MFKVKLVQFCNTFILRAWFVALSFRIMFRVSSNINIKLSSGLGTLDQNNLNIFFTQNLFK